MKHWNWLHTCNWTLNIYWTVHPSHIHLATDLWSSGVGETAPYWQVKQEWHEPQSTTTKHHHNSVKQHGQISSQERRVLTKKHEITQWGSSVHRKYSYTSERQVEMMGHIVWQASKNRETGHSGMKTDSCRVILNVHDSSTCRPRYAVGLSKDTLYLQDRNDHHYNHKDLPLDNWASSIHFTPPKLLEVGTDCRNIAICEVIIVVSLKITDFCDVMPCSSVQWKLLPIIRTGDGSRFLLNVCTYW